MSFGWIMFLVFWASIIIGAIIGSSGNGSTGAAVAVIGGITAPALWLLWLVSGVIRSVTSPPVVEAVLPAVDEAVDERESERVVLPLPRENSRTIPSAVKREVWARDGGCCVLCGASDDLHFDHEIPFSKGGASTTENVRILCARHNLRKGARIE